MEVPMSPLYLMRSGKSAQTNIKKLNGQMHGYPSSSRRVFAWID